MARTPDTTKPSPRDSAALCLQVGIALLALFHALRAGLHSLAMFPGLVVNSGPPIDQLEVLQTFVLPELAVATVLLIGSAPIARMLLRRVRSEWDAAQCYLAAAVSYLGIESLAQGISSPGFAYLVLTPVWPLEPAMAEVAPDLLLGTLLCLTAPMLALLWRARSRTSEAASLATPAG